MTQEVMIKAAMAEAEELDRIGRCWTTESGQVYRQVYASGACPELMAVVYGADASQTLRRARIVVAGFDEDDTQSARIEP